MPLAVKIGGGDGDGVGAVIKVVREEDKVGVVAEHDGQRSTVIDAFDYAGVIEVGYRVDGQRTVSREIFKNGNRGSGGSSVKCVNQSRSTRKKSSFMRLWLESRMQEEQQKRTQLHHPGVHEHVDAENSSLMRQAALMVE